MMRFAGLRAVVVDDPTLKGIQELVREVVVPFQWETLNDRVAGAEPSYCIRNFRAAAGETADEHHGMVFQDSDLYKWLEAAAYSLALAPDEALKAHVDEVTALIARAQQPDGYINTYYTMRHPEKRFLNLMEGHELYCAGHLFEAAAAMAEATGDTRLLDISEKFADCIASHFLEGGDRHGGYPGHPEIEVGLIRLYERTGKGKFLTLARYFIDARGATPNWFEGERARADFPVIWNLLQTIDLKYFQAHAPVREQRDADGHAVRAMYLYSAMADAARLTGDDSLRAACARLFESAVARRMYVTGGIGSAEKGERFTCDFDLPNDTAYAETCAAIGLTMFARRMTLLTGEVRYMDVWERALMNGALSGMGADGRHFFYVNPLESLPEVSRANGGHEHVLPSRQAWFGVACCPPNIARTTLSMGTAFFARESGDTETLHVLCHAPARYNEGGVHAAMRGGDGADGAGNASCARVLTLDAPAMRVSLRVPDGFTMTCEGARREGAALVFDHKGGSAAYEYTLTPRTRLVYAHPYVSADAGRACVVRGQTVYCLEECDNGARLAALRLPRDASFTETPLAFLPEGMTALSCEGLRLSPEGFESGFAETPARAERTTLTFVPYSQWNNRGEGEMLVWVPTV